MPLPDCGILNWGGMSCVAVQLFIVDLEGCLWGFLRLQMGDKRRNRVG